MLLEQIGSLASITKLRRLKCLVCARRSSSEVNIVNMKSIKSLVNGRLHRGSEFFRSNMTHNYYERIISARDKSLYIALMCERVINKTVLWKCCWIVPFNEIFGCGNT